MKKYTEVTSLNIVARAPFNVYFEGKAKMVSAANQVGNFDVLPGHADFFSVLSPCQVVITTDTNSVSFPITNGIITVRGDQVMLFVNM